MRNSDTVAKSVAVAKYNSNTYCHSDSDSDSHSHGYTDCYGYVYNDADVYPEIYADATVSGHSAEPAYSTASAVAYKPVIRRRSGVGGDLRRSTCSEKILKIFFASAVTREKN